MAKPTVKVGDVFYNRYGYKVEVIEYVSYSKIKVRFYEQAIYEKYTHMKELKNGKVNTPYHRGVAGVGYFGVGPYSGYDYKTATTCYVTWKDMLERCYVERKIKPTYRGCYVADEWHNFQSFAKWYYSQEWADIEGYQLDKDILFKGNKEYGPNTCRLVPKQINKLFILRGNGRGPYPIGVTTNGNNFQCGVSKTDLGLDREYLGTYKTAEEAFYVYKAAKEAYIYLMANKYKDKLDYEIYQALLNWKIDIND